MIDISTGKTVVCTVRQASSEVFALFDNVMLMTEGRVAYFGTVAGMVDHFSKLNFVCPEEFSPSDYFIRLMTVNQVKYNNVNTPLYMRSIIQGAQYYDQLQTVRLLCDKYDAIKRDMDDTSCSEIPQYSKENGPRIFID